MANLLQRLRRRTGPKPDYIEDKLDEYIREEQVEETGGSNQDCPLGEIEKILDREWRPTASNNPNSSDNGTPTLVVVKQYLVKWKGLSYLHCSWVPEQEFEKAYKSHPHLKLKLRVTRFNAAMDVFIAENGAHEFIAIRPEWKTVDRIIACREGDDGEEYLVKYKELSYRNSYWESESDISDFQNEIQRFKDINSSSRRDKYVENERNREEFKQFDLTPEFLTGTLHTYQLEGLNFLRYSWSKKTNVILADEMGLGKTIQSIAFLASLFEENLSPHLVVAPLSTIRNWEREFATWAPHMNVVMYTGDSEARDVIWEHEFYFSEGRKSKFDVLLTTYEMVHPGISVLSPIKWTCMIIDEGHRLKNQKSKLYSSLSQFTSKHIVLLTGTPLQNNLNELFALMHFLDADKFGSLEKFQDINKEEQISRLHQMLAPHLLRRLKKDVLKDKVPPKKELILRVDMSSQQKEVYKAVITNNYQVLTKKRDAKISNVLMKLRQVCSHPYLLPDFEPRFEDANEAFTFRKVATVRQMMVKLKEQGHRVLIYTQFQHTLYLLEDYFTFKNWNYERIDGKISGPERQVRIDRFNAENSNRFCFLLSTRAGGIGINLATADTVIIYDSDWNPHADLQAMARVHRLGQTNKVMIYRLIHKGTVEERMMEITKNKMLLEHLVVGKQHLCQDELDDIIKYGSKELFSEENDEAGRSGKIHYDDAAIEQLLDRNHVDAVEVSLDDEEETDFLKNFKVASFEYVDDENEAAALEEAQAIENNSSVRNADRTSHWKDLLKDKYEVQQAEELSALGKRKRNGKQVMYAEDDLDGLEEISDEEDEYCLDDLKVTSDEEEEADEPEAARQRKPRTVTRPYRKRARDNSEEIPLMEGEGRYLMVLGFNETERDIFLRTFKRYGAGNFDWKEFVNPLYMKTYDEINKYGILFLKHIAENPTDNSTNFKVITAMVYADGVPKEGISSDELLVSMTFMMLVKEKCQFLDNHPTAPVFSNYVISKYNLRNGAFSKEEHDRILIPAVSKHGYGRWVAIVEDEEIGFQEVACKDLNIPFPPDTKSARKRICDHVGKRVKKMEDAIKYEYAEKILAEQAKAETKGTSFVDAEKEMLKNDPITSKKNSATAVDNKQGRVEMAQSYDQSVNEKSGESFQTYLDIQPLNRMPRESFKPLEPINEEISTRLSVGTDHDVEMDAADNIIVLD
ncbi:CHD3-type chromatin-remodeling factor CHR7 [Arabidopsis thaliana]